MIYAGLNKPLDTGLRCSTPSLLVTVPSDAMHLNTSCYFADNIFDGFSQDISKLTPQEFIMRMEGYTPTGIKSVDANGKSRKLELKATIRESLKVSLSESLFLPFL